MTINYKRELETAAKNMILIHDPRTLVKMILRIIVKKVKVNHAVILLHRPDRDKDKYSLTFFGKFAKRKIPTNQTTLNIHNPLIRFFKENRHSQLFPNGVVVYGKAKKIFKKCENKKIKKSLKGLIEQMGFFSTVISIPSYFKDDLLGVLLLGEKNNIKNFSREELNFFLALSFDVTMAIRNAQLFEKLQNEVEKNKNFFINATVALTTAIDAKDHYTHGHTARVTEYTLRIAKKLISQNANKFDEKFLDNLYIASLLHDIGKIGVPEFILNKEGPLEPREREKMQEHPQIGVLILQPIKEIEDSILGVKYHHERYDGSGYPEGLKESEIPLIASIIAVADAFDAMTTNRPYRSALTKEEAIRQLKINCLSQFNPKIVEIIEDLYREGKI